MNVDSTKVTVNIHTDTFDELKALAILQGITVTNAINRAIAHEIAIIKYRIKGHRIGVIYHDGDIDVLTFSPTPKPL